MKTRISNPFRLSFLDYPTVDHCVTIYFTGCWGNCKGCHNKELINDDYDIWTRIFDIQEFFKTLKFESDRFRTNKVTLMGGDPLYDTNIEFTKEILKRNKDYDICLYTGQDLDFVKNNNISGFKFLKTGFYDENLYIDAQKTDTFFQLASTNQKIYDENFNLLTEKGKYEYGE